MTSVVPFQRVREWMFQSALPLWGGIGVDRVGGGFVERLDLDGRPLDTPYKRTRVTARQTYVFSHAALLGWEPAEQCARHGFAFLKRSWRPSGGWARRLTPDGKILDDALDLYDNAFALFALAWYYRAFRDPEALDLAYVTLDAINTQMRHESGLGFLHEKPPVGWRQQNPHMHLFEAALAWVESHRDERFVALANELCSLFEQKLFDPKAGVLGEFFDENLNPAPDDQGQITEPGHQLEWAWILVQHQKLTGADVSGYIRRLVQTAEKDGIDRQSGATLNAVSRDRRVLDPASRLWPNSERIKAHLAVFEMFGDDPSEAVAMSANLLLDRYLKAGPSGGWIDIFEADGSPRSKDIPASSLYHLFLAFGEMLRLEDSVRSA